MSKNRTIIAPATVPGRGGVSIVRMSGGLSKSIAEGMCGELAEAWRFKRCSIRSLGGSKIDDGMVVFFKSPNSYTGDDVVEFHCHGNPTIVNLVVEEAVNRGAVVAEPGEFTKTAFLNEKIDLVQAESVADLINAQSESAIVAANSSLSGQFSEQINSLLDGIVKARVVVEANIDFPEEEIDGSILESVKKELLGYHTEINELLSRVKEGVRLRDGYSVAIVGPPNAGKSSLLNLLAREDLAITSEAPGTTRDLVKTSVNIRGALIEFIDTAGVRSNPEGPIEEEGIKRSKEIIKKSNLSLLVQDATAVQEFDEGLGDSLTVLNKSDLLEGEFSNKDNTFYLSCSTGQGVEELLKALVARLGIDEGEETVFLSRQRHAISLRSGGLFLEEAITTLAEGQALELVAENLRSAHAALGDILRPMSADDLLGEIFSEFCIGK
ncbi:tRNA uridine-5-carboxymethylaminomethyl(34) synthesis GTPase MnmE [Gammaproteobacteria bacterium]|nr:tRNA uridine-5-carboxymethylaminomethyl(34) synthesis GTPase MnmE [Gammaproteobacteria bacterium]